MSWLKAINPFNKVVGVVSEFVEDKDKANELSARLQSELNNIYLAELQVKTVPWVDAVHKMGRQLMSYASMAAGCYLLTVNPDINPLALGAVVGPAGAYNIVKGRGK